MIFRSRFFILIILSYFMLPLYAQQEDVHDKMAEQALEAVEGLAQEAVEPVIETTTIEDVTDGTGDQVDEQAITDESPDTESVTAIVETPAENVPVIKDVILVLDNSGSMKKNDPEFLAKSAVNEFISQLDEATRVATIIYDQNVRMSVPLTDVSDATRETILKSLDQINYKGQYTDTPAAIERAIYDLKLNGRDDAKKLIIFMTDGIVDTGNADQDLEKTRWLKQDLAADAAESEIQIFGIAFTENADFQLIQSLAQQTKGEYYRALKAEDLKNVFTRVHALINEPPKPEPEPEPEPLAPPPPPPVHVEPPQPVIIEVPVQTPAMGEEERMRSMMIMAALGVLIIAVIVMVVMLVKGSRKKTAEEEYAQEAFLNDVNQYTPQSSYKLGNKPTMLGRVAGKDTEHLNYIVIPQTTIGRRHALIEYKDFAYWIIDQGSINGTFVNDQPISSEVRLKHGDKIRLHKFEFDFIMPEMVDAGMTQISNTVFGGKPAEPSEDITVARGGSAQDDMDLPEPDFDLDTDFPKPDSAEADTVVKEDSDSGESRDETIMLDENGDAPQPEDATIRPDNDDEEDVTIGSYLDPDNEKD